MGSLKVMMVAEKPSIASSIAKILSNGQYQERKGKLPVYIYSGTFKGQPADFYVTSVAGHVFNLDFSMEYQNWDTTKFVDLFDAKTIKKEATGGVIKHLKDVSKNIDTVVLWLDCDKEGENICFEVLNVIKPAIKDIYDRKKVFRARFSSITPPDIRKAMQNLSFPNENESLSVEARQELDLKIGVAFSRFQTRYFQGKYGDLDSSIISYGPCQTPTLGFVVERHDLITGFTPEKYWYIELKIKKSSTVLPLSWSRGRIFDLETCHLFHSLLKDAKSITVSSVHSSKYTKVRPLPINTVELLKLSSRILGMGPNETMQVAERLYLNGYISYPRTESTSYPDNFDIMAVLRAQQSSSLLGQQATEICQQGMKKPRKGVDAGDHPPISPTTLIPPAGSLSSSESRLYGLVSKYFLASLSPDCIMEKNKVTFNCQGETFSYLFNTVIQPGFTNILYASYTNENEFDDDEEEGEVIQEALNIHFEANEAVPIESVTIKEGFTSPPKYLHESELIALMESHSIGTDASIATHINNIIVRNYCQVNGNRQLIPTKLGIVLVHGYYNIDSDLVNSVLRKMMEAECNLIAVGKAKLSDVVTHTLNIFRNKFLYFISHISIMNSLFEPEFSSLTATGRYLSRCGICKRYMNYIHSQPQRLYCQNCNTIYKLPQNGTIKKYKELKCPLDNFELLLFSTGNSAHAMGTTYCLCPYCYNNPPFEDMFNMGCNNCLNRACPYSLLQNGVCPCPNSSEDKECSGMLVLDKESRPNWKLCCNRCNYILKFTTSVYLITVLYDTPCETCGSSYIKIEFNKNNTPLKDGQTSYEGCIICDPFLTNMTELKQGRTKHISLVKRFHGRKKHGRKHRRNQGLF